MRTRHANILAVLLLFAFPFPGVVHASQPLAHHIPAAITQRNLKPAGRMPASTPLNLVIGLPWRNAADLTNLLHDLYDPASPKFHHYLTPQQFAAQFGPT